MAPTQPYLYPPSAAQSQLSVASPFDKEFDPKAFTRASWAPPPPPKPKQEGPLISFNKHPDSYLIVPYGQTNAEPLPANTKKKVNVSRRVQLGIRVLQMITALGLLFCVIVIKNTSGAESYILRAPVGADVLSTGYGIYHLCRSAKSRPPSSSASYHFFSLVIDTGLIAFYVFTTLLARWMANAPVDDIVRWTSFFDANATDIILTATWLLSIVAGSLHLVTGLNSFYLGYIFREIASLPPDLNPLEDNLTSRRSRKYKHKYKNSELSVSDISGPTLVSSTRDLTGSGTSTATKEMASSETRPVSFLHTRKTSGQVYSPHNPVTAEASRSSLAIPQIPSMYQQSHAARMSRMDLTNPSMRPQDAYSEAPTKYSHRFMSEPSTEPALSDSSSIYTARSNSTKDTKQTPPLPRKSSKRHTLLSDNWFIHEDGNGLPRSVVAQHEKVPSEPAVSIVEEESDSELHHDMRSISPLENNRTFKFGSATNSDRAYKPIKQVSPSPAGSSRGPSPPPKPTYYTNRRYAEDDFRLAPLHMNPPTPPPASTFAESERRAATLARKAFPLNPASGNETSRARDQTQSPSYRSPGHFPKKSVGTPTKVKYYGDLGSAMAGVRGLTPSPERNSRPNAASRKGQTERLDWATQDGGKKGRVLSRTGADGDLGDGARLRGRNVSGKVAEEGRGGMGWSIWGR